MLPGGKISIGVTVKVLFELDIDSDEDIWTQVLKLDEETCSDPEQI